MLYEDFLLRMDFLDDQHEKLSISKTIEIIQKKIVAFIEKLNEEVNYEPFSIFDVKALNDYCIMNEFPMSNNQNQKIATKINHRKIHDYYLTQNEIFYDGISEIAEKVYVDFNFISYPNIKKNTSDEMIGVLNTILYRLILTIINYSVDNKHNNKAYKHLPLNTFHDVTEEQFLDNILYDITESFTVDVGVDNEDTKVIFEKVHVEDEHCIFDRKKYLKILYIVQELSLYKWLWETFKVKKQEG